MNPAFSVVFFTVVAGAAQGLLAALALALLGGVSLRPGFLAPSLLLAAVMLVVGLLSSFGHLGRKERAWRAVLMWRTSWLSRECLVLPATIGWTVLWWWAARGGGGAAAWWPVVALVLVAALWYCTAMIYACIRFIQEWAQPMTLVNFVLIGMASGFVLASALAAAAGEATLLASIAPAALVLTVLAGLCRYATVARNARLVPRSSAQSATGIRTQRLQQKSMGMSAGAFNTREFFHRASAAGLARIRLLMFGGGYVLPALLGALALYGGSAGWWWLAVLAQAAGLVADRWFFFAQARHPQNLYYQVVS